MGTELWLRIRPGVPALLRLSRALFVPFEEIRIRENTMYPFGASKLYLELHPPRARRFFIVSGICESQDVVQGS